MSVDEGLVDDTDWARASAFETRLARDHRIRLTSAEAELAARIRAAGWPHGPSLALRDRFEAGELSRALLAHLVPQLWRNRQDRDPVPASTWREYFLAMPFTFDYRLTLRPLRSRLLFRGATDLNREGIGWSLDIEQARYFARSRQDPYSDAPTYVWACRVPARRQLARYEERSLEHEIVSDVRGLSIDRVERVR